MRNRHGNRASFLLLGLARNRTIAFVGWMQLGEREPRSWAAPAAPRPVGDGAAPSCPPPCDAAHRSPEAQQANARVDLLKPT